MGKDDWLELVGYEKPYYYFDVKNYRMIVLDSNFFPVCFDNVPTAQDSVCLEQGKDINVLDVVDIFPDAEYYPGYVDQEQIKWLEEVLRDAADKKILVFVHQPPILESEVKSAELFVFNKEELRVLFEKFGVLAVFSGHIEELCHQEINGVKYFVIPGFYKENKLIPEEEQYFSVFSEVKVRDRDIDIRMFYKRDEDMREEVYETMMVDQSKSYCGKKVFDNL
jgi:3',5'-cyclic AMP phosphodiesterase CpdA